MRMTTSHSLFRYTILASAALFAVATLSEGAQVTGQNKAPNANGEQITTISVSSRLVVETVTVKDKSGKTIPGLTAKDFTITEDGVAQKISFCEHQSLPEDATPLTKPTDEDINLYYKLGRTQIAPENPGQVKYKDRRLIALYFDMSAMGPEDQLRSELAAQKFVRECLFSSR